jgi:hypothetical protein
MDIMYRAYRELQNAMSEAETYSEMTEALSQADDGRDMHGGTVALREIDMDWVEAIENAIPYIDAAIRDQRRFIVQEEEIVPIEKSREISSESVHHLAQHTNLIAKVEGDEVTPESILNIHREESFAIYENRFLRTLLESVGHFVEVRYEALCRVPDESAAQLEMSRIVRIRQEQVRVQLSYETEYQEENVVDIAADVSKLSKFQRVLRVRKIISNFMATPLMRSLVGCEPVRPPIMRTNLLTKNTNFRAVLELWVFLESYTKNGYYTVLSKSDGPMDPSMKHSLYDVISLTRFVVRMNLSEDIRKSLAEEYEAENARRAAEAARREEERRQEEERKRKLALAAQAQEYEDRIATLTADYEARIEEMNALFQEQATRMADEYEAQLSSQKTGYENQIYTLTSDYENQIQEMTSGYENQIQEMTSGYENRIQEMTSGYETQLDDMRQDHEEELGGLKSMHAAEMDNLKAQHEKEQIALQDQLAGQMAEFSQKQEEEFKALADRYAADADEARTVHERQMEEQQNAHAVEINALSASYEMKIADQAVRHSREVQDLDGKRRREREANALVKRELKSLEDECRELKRSSEQMKKQMKRVEERASRRIRCAELWNDIRVRRLKSKLEKAVAGYPLDEVRQAGEELWTMTADPAFDADDMDSDRFEYYRFEESPSDPEEEPEEGMTEKSIT